MQGAVNAESRRALIVVGALYAVTGIVFAWPESHVRMWRFAAWLVSAVAYATHIAYEHVRMRSTPGRTARHVALAVALGAFGLALSATIHSLLVASTGQQRRLVRLALVIWPIITGLPAFLVALAASEVLTRLRSSARSGSVK